MKLLQNRVLSATVNESNTGYVFFEPISSLHFCRSWYLFFGSVCAKQDGVTHGSPGQANSSDGEGDHSISFLLMLQSITTNLLAQSNTHLLS